MNPMTGLRVGYRRGAGRLPLTMDEVGQRGTWLEKRLALLGRLVARGHEVAHLSQPTERSLQAGHRQAPDSSCDVLMIEFAGTNMMFSGKDWAATCDLIQAHAGAVVFLCDDPDLPFPWKLLPGEDWRRWTLLANATRPRAAAEALAAPAAVRTLDAPFHDGLPQAPFADGPEPDAVYYGRANGRRAAVATYLGTGRVTIAGRPKEWPDCPVVEPPQQADRAAFYRQYRACLALYDRKHARTGWRTGRAYHAAKAGVPVCAPIGNPALAWTYALRSSLDLTALLALPASARSALQAEQAAAIQAETLDGALTEAGL